MLCASSLYTEMGPGNRLSIKMSYQYKDPHSKDDMGIQYLGKKVFTLRQDPGAKVTLVLIVKWATVPPVFTLKQAPTAKLR